MYVALNLIFLAMLIFLFRHWANGQPLAKYLLPALTVKLVAGVAIGILYQYYYQGGDTIFLFEQSGHLAGLLRNSPRAFWLFPHETQFKDLYYFGVFKDLNPRVLFFGKFTAIFHLITGGSYWLIGAYYSLFSLVGLWLCANQLAYRFKPAAPALAWSFFFFPSTVLWSSGLLKESLLWGFLGTATALVLHHLYRAPNKARAVSRRILLAAGHLALFAGCLYGLFQLKYYYLAALIPSLAALAIARAVQLRARVRWGPTVVFVVMFAGFLGIATQLHPSLNPEKLAVSLVRNYETMADATDIDNLVHYTFAPNRLSVLQNVPRAWWAALFVPLPWEAGSNPLKLLVGLENLGLLCLAIYQLFGLVPTIKAKQPVYPPGTWPLVLAGLAYIALLAVMLALATANIGTLIRYKNGFMPFFVALLLPKRTSHSSMRPRLDVLG